VFITQTIQQIIIRQKLTCSLFFFNIDYFLCIVGSTTLNYTRKFVFDYC